MRNGGRMQRRREGNEERREEPEPGSIVKKRGLEEKCEVRRWMCRNERGKIKE